MTTKNQNQEEICECGHDKSKHRKDKFGCKRCTQNCSCFEYEDKFKPQSHVGQDVGSNQLPIRSDKTMNPTAHSQENAHSERSASSVSNVDIRDDLIEETGNPDTQSPQTKTQRKAGEITAGTRLNNNKTADKIIK